MPTFKVTDPETGQTLQLTGDTPPTEQELEEIFAQTRPQEVSMGDKALGALETAATIGSSIVAEPIAGLAGVAQAVNPFAEEGAGSEAVEDVRQALTFSPETSEGRKNLIELSEFLQPVATALKTAETTLGEAGFELGELTGSDKLAAAFGAAGQAVPTAALELLGIASAKPLAKMKTAKRADKLLKEGAPHQDILKARSRELFNQVDDSGAKLTDDAFLNLAAKVEKKAFDMGADADVTKQVQGVLNRFERDLSKQHKLSSINTLREVAQGPASSLVSAKEKAIGVAIIDEIDSFVDNLSPKDFTTADGMVNAGQTLKQARDLWGRTRKSQLMGEAFENAKNQASGFENGLRIEARRLLKNKKTKKFFNAEEKAALEKVAQGTTAANLAKTLGRFGISEGQSTNALMSLLGAGAGGAAFGGPGFVAVPAVGQVSKKLAQRLTAKNAEFADAIIRAGKDGKKIAARYVANTPKKQQNAAELAELFIARELPLGELDILADSSTKQIADAAFFAANEIKRSQEREEQEGEQ